MLRRRFASFVLLAVIAARPSLGWAQTPAPPQSLDDIPSAKREDVSRLLSKIRRRHGEDAIVIQTHLLLNAMQKGAILATGVFFALAFVVVLFVDDARARAEARSTAPERA